MSTNTNLANVIPFRRPENNLHVVTPATKGITKPPCSTKMECLYNKDQVNAVFQVFKDKIENATTYKKEKNARRNLTMFLCAINIGLRGGDFCTLKWNNIYDKNWNIKDKEKFVPEKTIRRDRNGNIIKRKYIDLNYNDLFKNAISKWLTWLIENGEKLELDDYVFKSNKNVHIEEKSWYNIVEKTRREAGIKHKIGTHGLRKTYGHEYYLVSDNKGEAHLELQKIFGHADGRTTIEYICIADEDISESQEKLFPFLKE